MGPAAIAKHLGIARSSVYRLMEESEPDSIVAPNQGYETGEHVHCTARGVVLAIPAIGAPTRAAREPLPGAAAGAVGQRGQRWLLNEAATAEAAATAAPFLTGRLVAVAKCPVRALERWLAHSEMLFGPVFLRHIDWLHHRLDVTGPEAVLEYFQAAVSGAGIIPWPFDRDRMEEDLFHLLVAPPALQRRRLSLAGARVLARQLCDAAELRHAAAVARVGHSRACPFDLHALVPVPADILSMGPDHPESLAWLWAHWGTTEALRHVVLEPALVWRTSLPAGTATLQLSFWSADWTPWPALAVVVARWPALRFAAAPTYGLL